MITINRNVLKSALSNALKSINTSAALPVLECVLVSVEGQRLRLATTDLVTTFEQWLPLGSMAVEEMAIAVPARLFADMVAQAPVGDITLKIDTKKHEMTCQAGTSTNKIKCQDPCEFPPLPARPDHASTRLPAGAWQTIAARIAVAAHPEEVRPVLTGVLLEFAHESFTAVATDGFRLVAQTFACQTGIEEDVLVPAKGFAKAAAILGDEHPVELLLEGSRLIAFTEDALVAFQLIDQKYPDWQQIVPASFTNQTIIAHKGFEQAVKQALVISRGSDNKFAINLAAENNAVVVVGQDDAGSQSQSTLHSDIVSRAFFTINGAFLLQTVTALKSAVNLKLQSNQSTKAIQITSDQEPGFMAILMPITLGESHDLARADEMRSLAKAASIAMGMAE